MTAGKEKVGWQVSVIVLTVLTIVLGITTYIFYDKYRTETDNLATAETDKTKAISERDRLKVYAGQLANMVEHKLDGSADQIEGQVKQILSEFTNDQNIYGGTLPDDSVKSYPTMLVSHADQVRELQKAIIGYKKDIDNIQQAQDQGVKEVKEKLAVLQEKFDNQAADIRRIREKAEENTKSYQANMEDATQQIADKNSQLIDQKKESSNKLSNYSTVVDEQGKQIDDLNKELEPHRKWENEAPDGEIVRINQRTGTVYLNLGTADGLRRQTTFSVLPHDAKNALDVDPKGSVEVIRIVRPHLAEARITADTLSDPILPGDKIVSPIFRAGQPERFAVAGDIDIDGDGSSDMRQLLALIKRNGGAVDVYADKDGRQSGAMTSSTKFLIMGESPDEKSDQAVRDAFTKLQESADRYGVGRMSLSDFLDYVGYQGRSSVVKREVVSSKTRGERPGFQRRQPTGDDKKSAFDE